MTTKWTPVPWEFELMLDKKYAVFGQNARHRIATISNYIQHDDFANGRLIVAACNSYGKHCNDAVKCAEEDLLGDLLEALEFYGDRRNYLCDVEDDMGEKARAAIAKARGEAEEDVQFTVQGHSKQSPIFVEEDDGGEEL